MVGNIFLVCLQEDEPPEITYCVVDNAGTLTLQTMTPTQPMPPEEELNTVFAEFLVSYLTVLLLGLPTIYKFRYTARTYVQSFTYMQTRKHRFTTYKLLSH